MKICYVVGVCVNHDAISNAIRDEIRWLSEAGHAVTLFAYACDYADLPFVPIDREAEIVFHPAFQHCDVAVFHFGVFYSLFNVLPLVRSGAKRIVVFHNITPKEYLPPSAHMLIDRSFAQLTNMAFANHVICVSKINQSVLAANGVRTPSSVIPLPVHSTLVAPPAKPSFGDGMVRILFLGRFVKSKGPTEALLAVRALLRHDAAVRVQLQMIGNLKFSDEATLAQMRPLIEEITAEFSDRLVVELLGNAGEDVKVRSLLDADLFLLPTYHEGFCVPILEAIASGCLVVSYNNSNTPAVAGTLGVLVVTGDVAALALAVQHEVKTVCSPAWRQGGYTSRIEAARRHVRAFSPDVVREKYLDFIERRTADM